METIVLRAHFDGEQILLDDEYELRPNTNLLITVLREPDAEEEAWLRLSMQRLEAAYGESEPEYSFNLIKEPNPNYEGYRAGGADSGRRPAKESAGALLARHATV